MITTPIEGQAVLLDSNIIVYSSNTLSSKHEAAKEFRELATQQIFTPVIAHQNIFESLRVLTHPKYQNPMSLRNALKQIESFRQFCQIIHPFSETDEITLELIKKHRLQSNQIFDTYLAATMITNGVSIIATDNTKDFEALKEIRAFSPFTSLS